jgi:hypothetical protein
MLDRQSNPMETSSPEGVTIPLWQARHRSEVWKLGLRAVCCPPPLPNPAEQASTPNTAIA